MTAARFQSASGLRFATAFTLVTAVLVGIVVRTVRLCLDGEGERRTALPTEELPPPEYDVLDRDGRVLAMSVRTIDLVVSPRAMWQAHTPRRIARKLSDALGGDPSPDELLARLLPDAEEGVITVDPDALPRPLDAPRARRVRDWLRGVDPRDGEVGTPLRGISLVRAGDGGLTLAWEPAVLLSAEERARHVGTKCPPLTWSRRIADDLAACLYGEEAARTDRTDDARLTAQRRAIWRALMPCGETVALDGVPAERAEALEEVLDAEGVASHQMRVQYRSERRYPVRKDGSDAFAILGDWRYPDAREAVAAVLAAIGRSADELADPRLRTEVVAGARRYCDAKRPATGLEALCARVLESDAAAFVATAPSRYTYRVTRAAHHRPRRYFEGERPESETPRVRTTLDAELSLRLRAELERALEEHDAALAMGIVVDLERGDVLAVDGTAIAPVSEFLPTWHLFTPGSTFKVLTMACALDEGVVRPSEEFPTYGGEFRLPGRGHRVIREAEGAPTEAFVTAATGLARSVNAVLVQIGLRLEDAVFRDRLARLGYGSPPGVGIGVERAGTLPELPWARNFTHASICFGHEITTSLWQHATALAAVLRGGEVRPLRLVDSIEWGGRRVELPVPRGERVFRRETCETVRAMMRLGALEGTGRPVQARIEAEGWPLWIASKTGTAQKVPTEICLHRELLLQSENAERMRRGEPPVPLSSLRGLGPLGHRSCYTSSICLVGHVEGETREVMVLVVVEEPRRGGRFGSRVAGPAALAVLAEALGVAPPPGGDQVPPPVRDGFLAAPDGERSLEDVPWAETPELPDEFDLSRPEAWGREVPAAW